MALSTSQYQSIIRGYELERDNNRRKLTARTEEIYRKLPEYENLEQQISAVSVQAAKALISGDDPSALSRLHDDLNKIRVKRKDLLMSAGYPENYLEPIYTCSICKDTGYIPANNGTSTKCSCFIRKENEILYSQSGIRHFIEAQNFSTLSYKYYEGEDLEHFRAAVELSMNFVKNFNKDYRNILFYGTVGTGKSFLSGCIAKELLDEDYSVIYFSASTLFDLLAKYSFSKDKLSLEDFHQDIYSCDLLIIDDLGTELTNAFTTSALFSLINERYLRKKPVIISSNLNLSQVRDIYSERIFSRITSSYELCKITGKDIRILKKRLSNTNSNC